MKEIMNGRSFSQKLRIRYQVAPEPVAGVKLEVAFQLLSSLDWYCALFNHEAMAGGVLRNGPSNVSDSGKIRFPVFKRRCTHADKNRLCSRYCAHRRFKLQSSGPPVPGKHVLEVRLEERHLPLTEHIELSFVVVFATNALTDFRQACSGCESDISGTNH